MNRRTLDRINEDEIARRIRSTWFQRIVGGMAIVGSMALVGNLIAGNVGGALFMALGSVAAVILWAPLIGGDI